MTVCCLFSTGGYTKDMSKEEQTKTSKSEDIITSIAATSANDYETLRQEGFRLLQENSGMTQEVKTLFDACAKFANISLKAASLHLTYASKEQEQFDSLIESFKLEIIETPSDAFNITLSEEQENTLREQHNAMSPVRHIDISQ